MPEKLKQLTLAARPSAEPVAWSAFIRAVILCVIAFGVKMTLDQVAAVMLVVELGLALFTRSKVTPTSNG